MPDETQTQPERLKVCACGHPAWKHRKGRICQEWACRCAAYIVPTPEGRRSMPDETQTHHEQALPVGRGICDGCGE